VVMGKCGSLSSKKMWFNLKYTLTLAPLHNLKDINRISDLVV
jgi:hypothetical protein